MPPVFEHILKAQMSGGALWSAPNLKAYTKGKQK